jgi:hypothetical protein
MRAPLLTVLLALAGPAHAQTPAQTPAQPTAPAPACDTLDSPAGRAWAQANLWRYSDPARAAAVFRDLADSATPSSWPDGLAPQATVLPVGMRFQMAVAQSQILPDGTVRPGGWGTFSRVDTLRQAREDLAIRSDFKATLDYVLTFEVIAPLPALVGPTGPQVEQSDCHLLPGGWPQLQVLVLPADRMHYMKVVEQRPLH